MEDKLSGCGKFFGCLVAFVGLLASGIAIYQFLFPEPESPPPTPPPPPTTLPSFLEQLEGQYTLISWVEANRPVMLGAKVTTGSLSINATGIADWDVMVEQLYTPDPGQVNMTARGQVQLATQQIEGVQGGEFNNTHYLDNKWVDVGSDVELAVRGWDIGSPNDNFSLTLDTQSGGTQILEMKNSRGTFTWMKQ